MSETSNPAAEGLEVAAVRARTRLSFDLDVDVCVIGAGLAGLTVALECARLGASVAVLAGVTGLRVAAAPICAPDELVSEMPGNP